MLHEGGTSFHVWGERSEQPNLSSKVSTFRLKARGQSQEPSDGSYFQITVPPAVEALKWAQSTPNPALLQTNTKPHAPLDHCHRIEPLQHPSVSLMLGVNAPQPDSLNARHFIMNKTRTLSPNQILNFLT